MTALATGTGGWRAVSTVVALVLAVLVCLFAEVGHAAEPFDAHHTPAAELTAGQAEHEHDGSLADRLTHVAHCASTHGHAMPQPPFGAPAQVASVKGAGWGVKSPEHLTGLTPAVQDQPPRG